MLGGGWTIQGCDCFMRDVGVGKGWGISPIRGDLTAPHGHGTVADVALRGEGSMEGK